jgi:ribosomal protein S18 acetylase RimI-like enzyme
VTATSGVSIRRSLGPGDAQGIVALHDRVYRGEFGRNTEFVAAVARTVDTAVAAGWPTTGGGVWLVDHDDELAGCLGLTDEGCGVGHLRWFVFAPDLRGLGLGRRLLEELLAEARAQEMTRLELDTYSALTAAAHLYRGAGFQVVAAETRDDWGGAITYQHYVLDLR